MYNRSWSRGKNLCLSCLVCIYDKCQINIRKDLIQIHNVIMERIVSGFVFPYQCCLQNVHEELAVRSCVAVRDSVTQTHFLVFVIQDFGEMLVKVHTLLYQNDVDNV